MFKTYKVQAQHKVTEELEKIYTGIFKDAIRIATEYQSRGYRVTIYTWIKETKKYEVK